MSTIGAVSSKKRLRIKLPKNLKFDATQFTKPDPKSIPSSLRCKWIEGDLKEEGSFWCRKPVHKGSSWCKTHYRKVKPHD